MANLAKTTFQDAAFKDCKMLGLRFDLCNTFGLSFNFENCALSHSNFYKLKLKKTIFKNCQLHDVDLTECDLSNSIFLDCDFNGSIFENTIAEKVDFRTSYNFSIDPENNKIKRSKFSTTNIIGLLHKYDIDIE